MPVYSRRPSLNSNFLPLRISNRGKSRRLAEKNPLETDQCGQGFFNSYSKLTFYVRGSFHILLCSNESRMGQLETCFYSLCWAGWAWWVFCRSVNLFLNRTNIIRLYLKGQFFGLSYRNQLCLSLNKGENCWRASIPSSWIGSTNTIPKQVPQIFSSPNSRRWRVICQQIIIERT